MLAAVVSSFGFALSRGSLLTPTRSSRAFSASRVRLALDGEIEKSLYALGQKIGVQLGDLKCFSPKEIDSVFAGMKDNVIGAPSQVDLNEYAPKAANLFTSKQAEAQQKTESKGLAFLDDASLEEGAVQTDSGLVYLEVTAGEGDSPAATDKVKVHYEGRLLDGTVFDSSYKRGAPLEFPLNGVIKGWTEGLQLMKPGGKAKLTIPSDLAYGDAGTGPIPGKAVLVFDVELLAVL
jgi:FKBP-type peptidyl-prolyl cis-trans isomerase